MTRLTTDPGRRHKVMPDSLTTFAVLITNPTGAPTTASISLSDQPDWEMMLAEMDDSFQATTAWAPSLQIDLQPAESVGFLVGMKPGATLTSGEVGATQVDAVLSGGETGCLQLESEVTNQPKVYFISFDGLSPDYMSVGRNGLATANPAESVMPNLAQFTSEAAFFPQARDSIPAATDPNVFALLSGSWPGTSGMPYVFFYFFGWDEEGNDVVRVIDSETLRYGPTGAPVLSIFDAAKDPTYGGSPDNFTAFITGKGQLDQPFHTGGVSHLDMLIDGARREDAFYLSAPQVYKLGDPATDPNLDTDRDGVNIFPLALYRQYANGFGLSGDHPGINPSDEWVATSALRIIAAEDPDVFAVHFGSVDKIHHGSGVAAKPGEWIDPGTPNVLWDDINIYNRRANREPVLDVVYDADYQLGRMFTGLESREVFDRSYVTLGSDHSGITYMNIELDLQTILDDAGVGQHVKRVVSWMESGALWIDDPVNTDAVANALENYTIFHPVTKQMVQPIIVITRAEMDSGVDNVYGRFGRDGGPNRGETYSQWLIDYPVDDNSKVVWPEFWVFSAKRFQLTTSDQNGSVIGGHSGFTTMPVLLAMKGPGITGGAFSVGDVTLVDAVPTLYHLLGWPQPGNVDGRVLIEALSAP